MKTLICSMVLVSMASLRAATLTQSTVTEVLNNVDILVQPTRAVQPAKTNDLFKTPDLLRTGPSSRAELTAPDNTITRVGANTVFSYAASGREIDLEKGSVLFHSPAGKGGGTIKSGGASAAVSGTTLIVVALPATNIFWNTNGAKAATSAKAGHSGFKVIMLEGSGDVRLNNGRRQRLKAGEMTYITTNMNNFGPVITINLLKLVEGSALVHGFVNDLPSMPLINAAIVQQQKFILGGGAFDTGYMADDFWQLPPGAGGNPLLGGDSGDPGPFQVAAHYPGVNDIDTYSGGNNPMPGPQLPGYIAPVCVPTVVQIPHDTFVTTIIDVPDLPTADHAPVRANFLGTHPVEVVTKVTTFTQTTVCVPTYFPNR